MSPGNQRRRRKRVEEGGSAVSRRNLTAALEAVARAPAGGGETRSTANECERERKREEELRGKQEEAKGSLGLHL